MSQAPAGTATFAGFARMLGVNRSYVTQLRADGRLVLTDDGKRVVVDASRALVRESADPSKAAVAARHAATRADATTATPDAPPASAQAADDGIEGSGYQYWRERNERAKALASERDNAIADGKLMDAGEVATTVSAAVVTLRTSLEGLPSVLGPQLAGIADEARASAVLAEAFEHALDELSRRFAMVARAPA